MSSLFSLASATAHIDKGDNYLLIYLNPKQLQSSDWQQQMGACRSVSGSAVKGPCKALHCLSRLSETGGRG